ncbi:hypothetical protein LCGC14_1445780 [marine sediment metagenome]|uniref:Uncharacterized protein n=1 Tax=marine sediment metagenome TaxID=412755 RepID=A0A0F9MLB1_9ZZZZ
MDILTMNKLWIEHSHDDGICYREELLFSPYSPCELNRFEYLDAIGLFETNWMIYEYEEHGRNRYGYPDRYGYPSNE